MRISINPKFKIQSGRSMVEMLGVLAIVGVLSVGGIIGYALAMTYQRSNEMIYALGLRIIGIQGQLINGKSPLTLVDWVRDETIYPITLVSTTDPTLKTTDVPKNECQLIFNNLISLTTITVNNTQYTEPTKSVCDKTNTMLFTVIPPVTGSAEKGNCSPECKTDEHCVNYTCIKDGKPTGSKEFNACKTLLDCAACQSCTDNVCVANNRNNGSTCTTETKKTGFCVSGECRLSGCDSNSDCEKNEYCASPNSGDIQFPEAKSGACIPVDLVRVEITVDGKKEVYYASNMTTSWFDADSACQAINKQILSSVDKLTTNWDWKTGQKVRNKRAEKLNEAIGEFYVWTQDIHSKNTVFSVDLATGTVSSNYKYYDYNQNITLCE